MSDIKNRLLILDDEPNMCLSLKKLLELEGFDVVTRGSVQEGLEMLNSSFFDVVITDLLFPDGNGLDVLKFCTEYCRKTKVICMTGQASTSSAIEALRYGAHDYVTKPFNFDILLYSVNSVLEKMHMEEEIGLEKERYRALIEDIKDGYFVLEDRKIVYANQAMAIMLRCSVKELVGREFSALVVPRMVEKALSSFEAFERGDTCLWHEDLMFFDTSGNEIPVDIKFSMGHVQGERTALVGICREITERDILWERLIKAEKLALMGEMTAGIAHELNNKLTPILGFVEMLRMDMKETDNRSRIDAIHGAALGAREIVQSLLTFSRKEEPKKKFVNINNVIETSLSLVCSSFAASGIEAVKILQEDLMPVKVDAVQIEQVLTNIFKNAFEAMKDSGTLTVQTSLSAGYIVIKVTDTGPGISEEFKNQIFMPFFTTKERTRGTGLGLSICHSIIKNHGGEIKVRSRDSGASFIIKLPAASALEVIEPFDLSTQNDQPHDGVVRTMSTLPSLLVVDDEPEIGQLVKELFRNQCKVDVVENGMQAVDKLRKMEYDVIVSDVKMPLLDGMELYDVLKASFPQYIDRIIYTTGVTFDPATSAFFSTTGVPYLSKPFKVAQLVKEVTAMLKEGRNRRVAA